MCDITLQDVPQEAMLGAKQRGRALKITLFDARCVVRTRTCDATVPALAKPTQAVIIRCLQLTGAYCTMTQHEYVFIAISIILGLALSRLLNAAAGLIRAHRRVTFHWATALWGMTILVFILQLWWIGWELRSIAQWSIVDFFVLVIGSIFVYGAAELALPTEDYDLTDHSELVFLHHSRTFGRWSALSMLGYLCIGPHVNINMFGNPAGPSLVFPAIGSALMLLVAFKPVWFQALAVLFACYAGLVLYVTA